MLTLIVFASMCQFALDGPRDISTSLPNNYKPSPPVRSVLRTTLHSVKALKTVWIRGLNPVCWSFESNEKPETLKSRLLKDGFKKDASSAILTRFEPDRMQTALVVAGRWRCRTEHSAKAWKSYDEDKYTTVRITEAPYLAGPAARAWSPEAKQTKLFAKVPPTHINLVDRAEVVSMSIDETPSGDMQVWTTWLIKMPESELVQAMKSESQIARIWRTSPNNAVPLSYGSYVSPLDKSLKWCYLSRHYETNVPESQRSKNCLVSGSFVAGPYPGVLRKRLR